MEYLSLQKISKRFGDVIAVKDFDIEIRKGALVSFLGPSGCGKTTTLRMIAGFELPDPGEGRILLDQVGESACLGEGVDSPVFGFLNEGGRYLYAGDLFTLPDDLIATQPGHLKYVVCAETGQKQIMRCKYLNGQLSYLQQAWWRVYLNDPRTGRSNINSIFWGPHPAACPATYGYSAREVSLPGQPPNPDAIIEWLRGQLD